MKGMKLVPVSEKGDGEWVCRGQTRVSPPSTVPLWLPAITPNFWISNPLTEAVEKGVHHHQSRFLHWLPDLLLAQADSEEEANDLLNEGPFMNKHDALA